ncbi:hypothetical protein COOONC_07818 [Cooperia oncophora]
MNLKIVMWTRGLSTICRTPCWSTKETIVAMERTLLSRSCRNSMSYGERQHRSSLVTLTK